MSNTGADKHTWERDTRDARYDHMWLGEIIENVDPEGLGRCRVFVDGIFEPKSRWAFPMGFMLGVGEGIFAVPRVGAQVIVFLNQGDVDHPYYLPGPFGKPKGNTDVPPQVPGGDIDHWILRWGQFHILLDAKDGEGKLTIQDEVTTTRIEMDRVNGPGNYLRDVEGQEDVEVKLDRNVTVEEGNEIHRVLLGNRTKEVTVGNEIETIGGNKTKTVTGNEIDTINGAGGKVENVNGVAGSTEAIPAGPKNITAGLAVNIVAGAACTITAGGAVSITGAGVSVNAGAGPTTHVGGGLLTKTFLGGILSTITGAVSETINGAMTWTLNGLASLIGLNILLGSGTQPVPAPAVGYRSLVTLDLFAAYLNIHTHPGPGTVPTQQIVAPTAPTQPIPDPLLPAGSIDERLFSTQHVQAS